ncbi:MAG: hypothetical protein GY953_57985 [bacterium]|nr:hypothetical protein [bacterium]
MRYHCVLAAVWFTGAAWAQQGSRQSASYEYDVNGRQVLAGSVTSTKAPGRKTRAERVQTLNGRRQPLESVEERVISEGPDGRVVERIIQRYDASGQNPRSEKVRIEERKQPGGGLLVSQSVYRTDLNGRFALEERSATEITVSGDDTSSSTVVEKPDLNGSMKTVERTRSVERKRTDGYVRDVSTYRRDASGSLVEQERQRTELTKKGNRETETTTVYNAVRGALEFAQQMVAETEKRQGGAETQEVSIYGTSAMGRSVVGSGGQPVLREQRLVEKIPGPGGSIVERVSVSRATLADSGRMEPYQVVSEVVCTGACTEPQEAEKEAEAEEEKQDSDPPAEEAPQQP